MHTTLEAALSENMSIDEDAFMFMNSDARSNVSPAIFAFLYASSTLFITHSELSYSSLLFTLYPYFILFVPSYICPVCMFYMHHFLVIL